MSSSLLLLVIAAVLLLVAAPASAASAASTVSARARRSLHRNFHDDLELQYQQGLRQRPAKSGFVNEFHIEQPLDHFDRLNPGTYSQTYWLNLQYWDGTGPVFMFLGGEWMEGPETLEYGANVMTLWAKNFNGAMVNTQHRYYNGVPEAIDGNTTGLQYLSSEQALADLAALTAHLNRQFAMQNGSMNLRWIHIGGSYGGNMAAWYRLKYPHLSVGAFAISGPVQAVVDYTGFFSVEGHDLTPACLNFTRDAVRAVDALVADQGKGWDKIKTDFGITFNDPVLDPAYWGFELAWGLLGGGGLCREATNLTAYDTLVSVWVEAYGKSFNSTYDPDNVWSLYSWLWYFQTCTEMGYYQTGSNFDSQPLQIVPKFLTPPFFTAACERSYGVKSVWANIDFTNAVYGGWNISTTNTFFTHGDADGWSAAGVTYTDHPVPVFGNSVMIIEKGTHCSDLYFPTDDDSKSLKRVHDAQMTQVKAWLM